MNPPSEQSNQPNAPTPLRGIVQKPTRHVPALGNQTLAGEVMPFSINPAPNSRRVSIQEVVVHLLPKQPPKVIDFRIGKEVQSSESTYHRPRLILKSDWIKIDTGWLDNSEVDKTIGMVIVRNHGADRATQGRPTKEEKAQLESMIVEVSTRGDGIVDLFIPFDDQIRISSKSIGNWLLRSPNGPLRISVFALPK